MRKEASIVQAAYIDRSFGSTTEVPKGVQKTYAIGLHTIAVQNLLCPVDGEITTITNPENGKEIKLTGETYVNGYSIEHKLGVPGVPAIIFQIRQVPDPIR